MVVKKRIHSLEEKEQIMSFRNQIIDATAARYTADIEQLRIDAEVLLQHTVGIPGMGSACESFDSIVSKISHIESKLASLSLFK
jgi:hypothetical protein